MTHSPIRAGLLAILLLALGHLLLAPPARGRDGSEASDGSSLFPPTASQTASREARAQLQAALRRSAQRLVPQRAKRSQIDAMRGLKAPPQLDVLVIGCDFSDSLLWGRDRSQFPDAAPPARGGNFLFGMDTETLVDGNGDPIFEFAAHDSLFFAKQMERIADYFETVSRGQFQLNFDVHGELVNLPESMGYYGEDRDQSDRVVEMAIAVVRAVDGDVDFNAYDTVVLFHAGAGQETDILNDSPEQLFSTYLDINDFEEAVELEILDDPFIGSDDGAEIAHVLVLPETGTQDPVGEIFNGFFGTLGVYCFEFGLRLGMLNLADFTPSGSPDSQGIGDYGLMAYGLFTGLGLAPSHPCAMNRMLVGWVEAEEVSTDADIALGAIETSSADTLLVKISITDREYFLVEYRLQDPDGDLFLSFGDLNNNNTPDYFDADSDSVGFFEGYPTSPFDPATDVWEDMLGAEWDFFMSEFLVPEGFGPARGRGTGSGLYIWHVDERVIEDALFAGTATINADPHHKGVDVEEADGIQDLDSNAISEFFLGWDRDSWRGEGLLVDGTLFGTEFTPRSLPNSDSADGQPTGISIVNISTVSVDTVECNRGFGQCIVYREPMRFSLRFAPEYPQEVALKGSIPIEGGGMGHVRMVDLDADGSASEMVFAGSEGRVHAFRGDLTEIVDGDFDAATTGVLAVAAGPSGAPDWLGPPVIGDLDGDGSLEIILAAAEAIYAFDALTGAEAFDGDGSPATTGVFFQAPLDGHFVGSPLLMPQSRDLSDRDPLDRVTLIQLELLENLLPQPGPPSYRIQLIEWDGAAAPSLQLFTTDIAEPLDEGVLLAGMDGELLGVFGTSLDGPLEAIDLTTGLSAASIDSGEASVVSVLSYSVSSGFPGLAWLDSTGTVRRGGGASAPSRAISAPWSSLVGGPERDDGPALIAFAGGDELHLLDANLSHRINGPYRPEYEGERVRSGPAQPPILVDIDGDGTVEAIWCDGVGRIHAVNLESQSLTGWPLLGPGEATGSPAVADVDDDGLLELIALSSFESLVEVDMETRLPVTARSGELRIYDLTAPATSFVPWGQGRHDAWGTGAQPIESAGAGNASGGAFLDESSFFVYPNPAQGSTVRVRVLARRSTAMSAAVYDLEGQQVAETQTLLVEGGAHFDVEMDIAEIAGGLYMCRVEGGGEALIKAFAVVR